MKDACYFTHDDNARHDPKIKALIKKYNIEGYGRFWVIIEIMRSTKGHKLIDKPYVLEALAEELKCSLDEIKKFLDDCVRFELFIKEDGFYYSESLGWRMAKLESIISKNRTAAYIMHEKYHHNVTKDPNAERKAEEEQ
jgi:hypothetical protein